MLEELLYLPVKPLFQADPLPGLGGSGKMRRFRLLACGAGRTWVPPKAATRFARFGSASGTADETADRCEEETHDLIGGLGGAGRGRLPAV